MTMQIGQGRRALAHELHSILDEARNTRFTIEHDLDQLSALIAIWATNFLAGLSVASEAVVVPTYTEFMQDILMDPYTEEPLDSPVRFGNDGYTYGFMSYEISYYVREEAIRDRSPMFPNNPRRFVYEPHPLAERMLIWLQVRGARYYSQGLIDRHRRIVPQTLNTSRETDDAIDLLLSRQRSIGVNLFEEQLAVSVTQITLEVELEGVQNQNEQTAHALQSSQRELDVVQEANHGLQQRMEAHMRAQVAALSAPSTAMNAQTVANLNHLSSPAQQALNQLRQTRDRLHAELAQLEREKEEIKKVQQEVAKECDQLKQGVAVLQQSIVETKEAIKKAKMVNVFEVIAWTAGSVFGSMALNALIGSGSLSATTSFTARSAKFSILITG